MKIFKAIAISFLFLLIISCTSVEFILTGNTYQSLSEDYPIKVIFPDTKERIDYEEIGVVRVAQTDMNNLKKAVERAKEEARRNGGDIIEYTESSSQSTIVGNSTIITTSNTMYFIFFIGKIKR